MRNKILWLALWFGAGLAQAQPDSARVRGHVTNLQECLARGLEHNFSIKMVKNQQEVTANNATPANAGLLPTVDLRLPVPPVRWPPSGGPSMAR